MRVAALVFLLFTFTIPASARSQQKAPLIVFVTADQEYGSEETMPALARALEKNFRFRTRVLRAYPDQNADTNIPGLDFLKDADLVVFFMRWQKLPAEQVAKIEEYLKTSKPVIAFRTSTHAFNYPKGDPLEKWNAFGHFALGSPPGWGADGHTHYGHNSSTDVEVNPEEAKHPILYGIEKKFHVRSWLYHVVPKHPPAEAKKLLIGTAVDPDKPAVPSPIAWTWRNEYGAKVFMTTMGHPEDFRVDQVQHLLVNAFHWALNLPIPKDWNGSLAIDVPYRGVRKSNPP
jgi:type 1 glutamine amidotransferase